MVHAAHVHDAIAACDVLGTARDKYPRLEAFSGDAGYRGTAVQFVEDALGLYRSHMIVKFKKVV